MQGVTHMMAGIVSAMAVAPNEPKAIGLAALGSILPDIDHGSSFIGRRIPFVNKFVKHRGVTHSLIATVIAFYINPWLGLGYASHIILDMLTKQGVRLLFPFYGMYGLKIVRTGGVFEKILRTALIGCFFIILFKNILNPFYP